MLYFVLFDDSLSKLIQIGFISICLSFYKSQKNRSTRPNRQVDQKQSVLSPDSFQRFPSGYPFTTGIFLGVNTLPVVVSLVKQTVESPFAGG